MMTPWDIYVEVIIMNRTDFPILDNNIYLDSAATTLKPKCVIDKITEYYSDFSL